MSETDSTENSSQVRTRFAPSPTGVPHIGNFRTVLFNWLWARKSEGQFVVRVEDTDRERYVPESLPKILEGLEWLGLKWDEGPKVGGLFAPYVQSERLELYQKYAKELIEVDAAYYCFCSQEHLAEMRKKQEAQGEASRYDKTCRTLSKEEAEKRVEAGEKYVIRLKVPESGVSEWEDLIHGKVSFENKVIDDQVLIKSDGFPTYQLAVVVDDHLMEIDPILRGDEWISSTPKQMLLYKALGWEMPQIGHVPLVFGPDGSKLSKRHGAKSALEYRDEGYLKEAVLNTIALWGWTPKDQSQLMSLEEMVEKFDIKDINVSAPKVDLEKLNWFNGQWIRKLEDEEILKRLQEIGYKLTDGGYAMKILSLIKDRMVTLRDFDELTDLFFEEPGVNREELLKDKKEEEVREQMAAVCNKLQEMTDWTTDVLEKIIRDTATEKSWDAQTLFMTLRVAITGKTATPPLFETMEVLGHDKVLKRLNRVITELG